MPGRRIPISSLNRKLLRDLLAMKGQALAIALVVAAGVAMYVMYLSNFESLRRTQQAFYERHRFADVFVSLERAPLRLREEIAAIPGVTAVEVRVAATVTMDVEGLQEPATGRLVSIEAERRPRVNDLFLGRGRWVDAARPDEVIASEAFVAAHGFVPGDSVRAVINGRARRLTIVGVALSPEYVYNLPPGEIIPDDRRFGIFWMERKALASAFDMEGGFNDAAVELAPRASSEEVIARVDRLLQPYGGQGAIPRSLQLSHWMLESELSQLQSFGFIIPLIFLLVAAFILNVAMVRALAIQRPQIAALKALGYSNGALGWHYLKWALLIATAGIFLGVVVGAWLGAMMIDLYNEYFRFPELLYQLSLQVVIGSALMTVAAAVAGAITAVRRAVGVPPAEAMRPEAPATYRRTAIETPFVARQLGTAGRMVIRNVARHPFRSFASVVGIGFAGGILVVGFVFVEAMNALILMQFSVAERQDVTLTFVEPRSSEAYYELQHLPGVLAVEPQRMVAARLRAGHRERTLAIAGVGPGARLKRIVDRAGRSHAPPLSGLMLSEKLAEVLNVVPGDEVTVEVLEGRRPVVRLPVTGVVDDILGLSAYMATGSLHRLLNESEVITGAALLVDPSREAELARRLKDVPAVTGAGFMRTVERSFRETLAANMDLMIWMNVIFAGIIAFGVVYNAARVSLSERSRELASLRVLGYTRAEISLILLGELALLTLAALPLGAALGHGMASAIAKSVESEVYRIPLGVTRRAIAWGFLSVIGAAFVSGLVVRRRLDRLDLIAVLKVRE
jgi:putative ABC transport system permease protein